MSTENVTYVNFQDKKIIPVVEEGVSNEGWAKYLADNWELVKHNEESQRAVLCESWQHARAFVTAVSNLTSLHWKQTYSINPTEEVAFHEEQLARLQAVLPVGQWVLANSIAAYIITRQDPTQSPFEGNGMTDNVIPFPGSRAIS